MISRIKQAVALTERATSLQGYGVRLLRGGNAPGVGPGQKIDTLAGDGHDGRVRMGADDPGHDGGVHDPEAVDPLDPQVGRDDGRGVIRLAHATGANRVKRSEE